MEKKTFTKLVTYHSRDKYANQFAQKLIDCLEDNKKIKVSAYHGENKKEDILINFKTAEEGILCVCRYINEGVNIPEIDAVAFLDPRESVTNLVQIVGRCVRLHVRNLEKKIAVVSDIPTLCQERNELKYAKCIRLECNSDKYDIEINDRKEIKSIYKIEKGLRSKTTTDLPAGNMDIIGIVKPTGHVIVPIFPNYQPAL